MTDQRLEEIIQESIIAVTAEYAEDLQEARELLARTSRDMTLNPYATNNELHTSINDFLERMAVKEMIEDLE
jgi:hypothetical protein